MALDKFQPYLFVSAGEQSNKYLTPTITNGIAQFQAQRAQELTGLTVRIGPIQEGTGDPSPTNIRPISGRTGLTVTRAGKNLLYTDVDQYSNNGITIVKNADGSYTLNGTATAQVDAYFDNVDVVVPNGEYLYNGVTGGSQQTYRLYLSIRKGNSTRYIGFNDGDASVTLTDETIRAFVRITNGAVLRDVVIKPMLRPANISDGTFVPYTAHTYPITWESIAGTVYGGTLDVVSGVLTVDKGFITYDGSSDEQWGYNSIATGNMFRIVLADRVSQVIPSYPNDYLCNAYKVAANATSGRTNGTFSGSTTNVDFVDDRYSTVEEWRAALAQTPIQFVYPLATPQTYQLTPTEVRTIAGFNQIYSDAGPVIDIKF